MKLVLVQSDGLPGRRELAAALGGRVELAEPTSPDSDAECPLARRMEELERLLNASRPGAIVIRGADMSAAAAALVTAKLELPLVRLEAGAELAAAADPGAAPAGSGAFGRVCDRLATLLLCSGESERAALERAGLGDRAQVVGDDPDLAIAAIEAHEDRR